MCRTAPFANEILASFKASHDLNQLYFELSYYSQSVQGVQSNNMQYQCPAPRWDVLSSRAKLHFVNIGEPCLTSTSVSLTTATATATPSRVLTPVIPAPLPLALGTLNAAQGCLAFQEHRVVPPTTNKFASSEGVNSCDFVTTAYEVDYDEFLSWNPSLQGMGGHCYLQSGYRYCIFHRDATDLSIPEEDNRCLDVGEPYPGTVSSCSCFTFIEGREIGYYLCEDIAEDFDITVSDLVKWNTWVRAEWRCDSDLYNGLAESERRPVCVDGNGPKKSMTQNTSSLPRSTDHW
ncbi:hypothetical protein PG995_005591 [Apiospora arundinis]